MSDTPPWSAARIAALPVRECGEPLVDLGSVPALRIGPETTLCLRTTVVDRLVTAQSLLPRDLRLLIVEGHRTEPAPDPPFSLCRNTLLRPHHTGAAADVTLCTITGEDLSDTPSNRIVLHRALTLAGLVDLPSAWWHWSYGDLYWSHRTGAPAARYGPIDG